MEDLPSKERSVKQISTSLSSHDTTRVIGFQTLMHFTNAIVIHFTYAFNIGEVGWPKRFSKSHKVNYRLIPNAIRRGAEELKKCLYVGPSTLLVGFTMS